jgi:hypothetical protein
MTKANRLPLLDVESVIAAARAIADIKTKKGQSRLIPKCRQRLIQVQYLDAAGQHEAQRTTLSPGMPTDKLVKEDANTILEKLNGFMQSEDLKDDAIWFVNYVINHVSPHKSGVAVYHLDDASRFIYVLRMLVAPNRIYLQHNPVNPKMQPAGYDERQYKDELLDYLSINEGAYCNVGNLRAGSEDQLGKLLVWVLAVKKSSGASKGLLTQANKPVAAYLLIYACHIVAIELKAKGDL